MQTIRRVICGISGGVDSAVSAFLLKKKGFDVQGLFMTNWDKVDETGVCTADKDREDARYVCNHLDIPFNEVNFVKEYWTDVFSEMVRGYEEGKTPNPDILCNRHIKFGAFFDHATKVLGGDAVATGHYARNSYGTFLENRHPDQVARLLTSVDTWKDQTLFLCQIKQKALQRHMFPIGDLMKDEVKKIASEIGLQKTVNRKESMGICFVGKKDFPKFIEQYIEHKPGDFVDVDTGSVVGKHNGTHHWTLGQRALIGGLGGQAYFISKLDARSRTVYVAKGTHHPALFTSSVFTSVPHWIHKPPEQLYTKRQFKCQFRFQHIHPLIDCSIRLTEENGIEVEFERPLRALTPGQYAVFYDGDTVLGSGEIIHPGPSLKELENMGELTEKIRNTDLSGPLGC